MSQKIVLKLGGSVITDKDAAGFPDEVEEIKKAAEGFVRIDQLRRIAKEIKEAISGGGISLILVNGVGPFGHSLVERKAPVSTVQVSTEALNDILIVELRKAGIDAVPLPPAESVSVDGKGALDIGFLWRTAELLLEEGKVPSIWGDQLKGGKVVSGDDLAVMIAKVWKADRILMATDVEGVCEKDPKDGGRAKIIRKIEAGKDHDVEFSKRPGDVTGGMGSKVERLLKAAADGYESQIFDGRKAGNVKAALLGDKSFGTVIAP